MPIKRIESIDIESLKNPKYHVIQGAWNSDNSDPIADIEIAIEITREQEHTWDPDPPVFMNSEMADYADKLMEENGLKTTRDLFDFIAAKIIKEDGVDKLWEILSGSLFKEG